MTTETTPVLIEEVKVFDQFVCGGIYRTFGDQLRFAPIEGFGDGIEAYTEQEARAIAKVEDSDRPAWLAVVNAFKRARAKVGA